MKNNNCIGSMLSSPQECLCPSFGFLDRGNMRYDAVKVSLNYCEDSFFYFSFLGQVGRNIYQSLTPSGKMIKRSGRLEESIDWYTHYIAIVLVQFINPSVGRGLQLCDVCVSGGYAAVAYLTLVKGIESSCVSCLKNTASSSSLSDNYKELRK